LLLATIGISIDEILAGLDDDVDVELAARAVVDGLKAAGIMTAGDDDAAAAAAAGGGSAAGSSGSDAGAGGEAAAPPPPPQAEAAVVRREVDVIEMRDELQRALALTELDASRDEAAAAAEEDGDGSGDDDDGGGGGGESLASGSTDGDGPLEFCRLRAAELLEAARRLSR
jgi:hypothetical protein